MSGFARYHVIPCKLQEMSEVWSKLASEGHVILDMAPLTKEFSNLVAMTTPQFIQHNLVIPNLMVFVVASNVSIDKPTFPAELYEDEFPSVMAARLNETRHKELLTEAKAFLLEREKAVTEAFEGIKAATDAVRLNLAKLQ